MSQRRLAIHRMALDAVKIGAFFLTVLLGLEAFESGFVSRFFNVNLLVLWILGASAAAFFSHSASHEDAEAPSASFVWIQLVGIAASLYVWTVVPDDLRSAWKILAAGGTLLITLLASSLIKKE